MNDTLLTAGRAAAAPVSTPTAGPAPAGVRLRDLSKVLGGRTIVDRLNLDIARGELVSLLGPSGCGKTTTLRMIAGFLIPDDGSVWVDGRDLTGLGPERRPSAMVFQSYALWPHMTVEKNVGFPLKLRRLPKAEIREKVDAVLRLVNLTHHAGSRPARISGGEQQRVALARALVQEPQVLLLDEPLSNLDAKLRVRVREEIRDIQRRLGITTILVTHDQEEAMAISDRVAVMNGGRIEQVSSPAELYATPQTEFVASFVGTMNIIEAGALGRGDDAEHWAVRPEDVRFARGEAGDATIDAAVVRVRPKGHYYEVVYAALGRELVGLAEQPPALGETGWLEFRSARLYRDGMLQEGVRQ